MSSVDLEIRFKIGMYLLNRKSVTNPFPRSTGIIQILNELPTDKRHIKGPDHNALHAPTTRKQRFSNIFFLEVLHDQTSVESL